MNNELGRALIALITDPIFITLAVIVFLSALSLKKNGKTHPKGVKIALIAACALSAAVLLLLSALVLTAAMTVPPA